MIESRSLLLSASHSAECFQLLCGAPRQQRVLSSSSVQRDAEGQPAAMCCTDVPQQTTLPSNYMAQTARAGKAKPKAVDRSQQLQFAPSKSALAMQREASTSTSRAPVASTSKATIEPTPRRPPVPTNPLAAGAATQRNRQATATAPAPSSRPPSTKKPPPGPFVLPRARVAAPIPFDDENDVALPPPKRRRLDDAPSKRRRSPSPLPTAIQPTQPAPLSSALILDTQECSYFQRTDADRRRFAAFVSELAPDVERFEQYRERQRMPARALRSERSRAEHDAEMADIRRRYPSTAPTATAGPGPTIEDEDTDSDGDVLDGLTSVRKAVDDSAIVGDGSDTMHTDSTVETSSEMLRAVAHITTPPVAPAKRVLAPATPESPSASSADQPLPTFHTAKSTTPAPPHPTGPPVFSQREDETDASHLALSPNARLRVLAVETQRESYDSDPFRDIFGTLYEGGRNVTDQHVLAPETPFEAPDLSQPPVTAATEDDAVELADQSANDEEIGETVAGPIVLAEETAADEASAVEVQIQRPTSPPESVVHEEESEAPIPETVAPSIATRRAPPRANDATLDPAWALVASPQTPGAGPSVPRQATLNQFFTSHPAPATAARLDAKVKVLTSTINADRRAPVRPVSLDETQFGEALPVLGTTSDHAARHLPLELATDAIVDDDEFGSVVDDPGVFDEAERAWTPPPVDEAGYVSSSDKETDPDERSKLLYALRTFTPSRPRRRRAQWHEVVDA